MTTDEIIDKIAKLLRLSKSPNVNEAALAAAKAQEMMDKYRIDAAAVDVNGDGQKNPDEPIEDYTKTEPLDKLGRKGASWKSILAGGLGRVNNCRSYRSWARNEHGAYHQVLGIVGRKSDVQVVRYMYQYLVREIDRLTKELAHGNGRSFCNAFRLGAVATVRERLQEAKAKTEREMREQAETMQARIRVEKALVRVDNQKLEVDIWVRRHLHLGSGRRVNYSSGHGYVAGRQAGHSIRLGGARGALGTAATALPRS